MDIEVIEEPEGRPKMVLLPKLYPAREVIGMAVGNIAAIARVTTGFWPWDYHAAYEEQIGMD